MPYAMDRSLKVHYTVSGDGPCVVFLHGLFDRAASWQFLGFVSAFTSHYKVVCIDFLGHGESDKPTAAEFYTASRLAQSVLAVMDELEQPAWHHISYSMGSWVSIELLREHSDRLLSLSFGGWYMNNGLQLAAQSVGRSPDFDGLFNALRRIPGFLDWVRSENEIGLRACWSHMLKPDNGENVLKEGQVPLLIWVGKDDPYHPYLEGWAQKNKRAFLSLPGNHITCLLLHASKGREGLRQFVDGIEAR
jgi:pimeloyl-ACP methyl ester carboxylesterase